MLIGEYAHNLDPKGRLSFPAKLREGLGETFVVSKNTDGCLCAYSHDEWSALSAKIRELPTQKSKAVQRFLAGSLEAEPDKQGRVLIPAHLREYAGLSKDIMVIGASTRVEIWDKTRWEDVCGNMTQEELSEIMDELVF